MSRGRVLIVGAGASGITACKELAEAGFDCVVCEKAASLGGVFRDAYPGLQLTSSTALTSFSDFPWSAFSGAGQPPKMWNGPEYLAYLQEYIANFKLGGHLYFGREVVAIDRPSDGGPYWRVRVRHVSTGKDEEQRASLLVLSTGSHTQPKVPIFDQDAGAYTGRVCHSASIDDFAQFAGQRVVCVGVGESGSDIPLLIQRQPGTTVHISMRGCGWVFTRTRPRKGGLPADLNTNRVLWGLPLYMNSVLSRHMAAGDAANTTDPVIQRLGEINQTHPAGVYKTYGTKSSSFIEAIVEHGAQLRPQIAQLGPGKRVTFLDGTTAEADAIVCNTGYGAPVFTSLLPEDSSDSELRGILRECATVRDLYKRCVHPRIPDRLFFVGFARPQHGSIPPIAELQARWIAAFLTGAAPELPAPDAMRAAIHRDRRREECQFDGAAARVVTLADFIFLTNDLADQLGAAVPWFLLLCGGEWQLLFQLMFAVQSTVQFRLAGPGARPELARSTILQFPVTRRRKLVPTLLYLAAVCLYVAAALLLPLPQAYLDPLRPNGFGWAKRTPPLLRAAHAVVVSASAAALLGPPSVNASTGALLLLLLPMLLLVKLGLWGARCTPPSCSEGQRLGREYSTAIRAKNTKWQWVKKMASSKAGAQDEPLNPHTVRAAGGG
jgi:dimethylaniline monooxygenase (N-oxide forming)